MQIVVTRVHTTECGIDIASVLGILPPQAITPIPGAQPEVLGLIVLRGQAVPIVDFRLVLGAPAGEFTAETRFVLVQTGDDAIELVVDGVAEVLQVEPDMIQELKDNFAVVPAVRGIIRLTDRLILHIDHEQALGARLDIGELESSLQLAA